MGPDVASEEQFGPYLVYERLGVGGMATVHRALERGVEGFERFVALKRLLPHLAEDASFIKAFVREAKLASMLTHVNIVQIYELGRVGTEYFISMEYIEGRDVRKILRHARRVTGPAPLHVTVGLMLQLLEALDYAHTKVDDQGHALGLVHRDVSPSNLLVTPSGHLKVIDFGIAKAQSSQLRTQTGRVKGKLAYMAPEAISGSKDLDARSDVWACGVILHELLTARPLFASKNEYQTLMKVQRGDIMPPSTFNQACTPELDAIAFKALARDPDDRFANALEMRDELNRVRKQYQLQTSHRDVAMWLDWAFSLEPPAGFSGNTFEPSGQMVTPVGRMPTPAPVRARNAQSSGDEEEAVEMVWGTGEAEDAGHSGPIVLEDVPDVSGKHLAARAETFVTGDDVDVVSSSGGVGDIPVHQPSHGTAPRGSRPSDRMRAATADVDQPDLDFSRPRPRTSNPPPIGTARDSSRGMEDLFGLDPSGDDEAATLAEPIAVGRANTQEPVVRFSNTGQVAVLRNTPPPEPLAPPPRTRPGVQPAQALKSAPVAIAPATQKPVSPSVIGASMVERNRTSRWWMVLGLVVLAGGGAAVAMYVTGQHPATPATKPEVPVATGPATVKFDVAPADAEIRIDGTAHTGSPWSTELAPGVHQVEIHRSGYTAYLTSLDLSANDKHSLHIELRPLGTTGATGEAMLAVASTPSGLEAELDGVVLPQHTPIKVPIKPGSHVIVLKRGGVEVWRQTVNAEASSDIELNPSFTTTAPQGASVPGMPPTAHTVKKSATDEFVGEEPAPPAKADASAAPQEQPPAPAPLPERPVVPAPPPVPAPPTPTPTPPPMPTGPITVAPNAVTKIAGESPNISRYKAQSLPAITAAKLCIDKLGNVASVDFVGKLDKRVATDLADQLKAWKYKPYALRGTAVDACFVVTMRMK